MVHCWEVAFDCLPFTSLHNHVQWVKHELVFEAKRSCRPICWLKLKYYCWPKLYVLWVYLTFPSHDIGQLPSPTVWEPWCVCTLNSCNRSLSWVDCWALMVLVGPVRGKRLFVMGQWVCRTIVSASNVRDREVEVMFHGEQTGSPCRSCITSVSVLCQDQMACTMAALWSESEWLGPSAVVPKMLLLLR